MIIYHLESHQFLGIFCWLFLDWRQMRVSTVNRNSGDIVTKLRRWQLVR